MISHACSIRGSTNSLNGILAPDTDQRMDSHPSPSIGDGIPYYQVPELEHLSIDLTQPLILLAEDDESNILTIAGYLSLQGYRLIVAKDGQEALLLAQTYQPNLLLIDLQMPNIDGIETIQQLRANPSLTKVPILVLTAMVATKYRDRALAVGADDYLTKPIRMKQLLAVIQDLLLPDLT